MSDDVRGLLFSQIGHDAGETVRAIYRAPVADALPAGATLAAVRGGERRLAPLRPWGRCWNAHWWTADFGALPEGEWRLEGVAEAPADAAVTVAQHRLWRSSWRAVALEQLERRTRISRAGHGTGWQDCGCDWQEANSHAACTAGLCDILLTAGAALDERDRARAAEQIRVGCRMLDFLQDMGPAAGLPAGALVHEQFRARRALARDALWAALAWARAARALGGEAATAWRARAGAALAWWAAQPVDHTGMDRVAHDWRPGYVPPSERPVGDRALAAWAHGELAETMDDEHGRAAAAHARAVLDLQIAASGPGRPFGHFWEFADRTHPAPVWTHNNIGPDTGDIGLPPLLPIALLLRRWPAHADARRWREALHAHAEGWLLPASAASPFGIAARLWKDGWVHFSGLWHGMNAAYGLTAALCDEAADLLRRPELRALASANRQWIAGLNAGLTAAGVTEGCHMTIPETIPGRALPASMITGVGRRWVGGWVAIPGTVSNGFGSGDQFRFDVPADPARDAPTAYTDEEWVPHAGAWIMAVARAAG